MMDALEDLFSMVLAFGLWPALPITGYWVFSRFHSASKTNPTPFVTSLALMTVAGITVWSPLLHVSAMAGIYRAEYFGLLGWIATLLAFIGWFKQPKISPQSFPKLSVWDWVLAGGLLLAASLYLGFPTESIMGGRDMGIYANHGTYIANHGRLDIPYPWDEKDAPIFSEAFRGYPAGVFTTQPTMTVRFFHLFPVWLAHAFSTSGHHGLFRLNGVLALLFLAIFYGVCRLVTPKPHSIVATLFLALNPSEVWSARITLSEVFAQLLIWSGLFLLMSGLKDKNKELTWLAGLFLGLSAFVRIDGFFLVPFLFLAHLALKITEDPMGEKSSAVWTSVYLTALPLFALAINYHTFFSRPYFMILVRPLEMIALASLVSLFALLALTPKVLARVRPWFTGKTALALIGIALFTLAAYAYWIRPNLEPYAIISWPGHHLDGTRYFREDTLVNLAQYLSPVVVWAAILSWYFTLCAAVRKGQNIYLLAALVVIAGFSALYLWNPAIRGPDHFYAIRRFVPVVIPGFVFFAALGSWWVISKASKGWSIGASALVIVFLSLFTIRAGGPIFAFAEDKGYFMQLQQLAQKLPQEDVILAHEATRWGVWVMPLYLAFDRKVISIDLDTEKGKSALNLWIAKKANKQRPVYLLYEGRLRLVGFEASRVDEVVLLRSYTEQTVKPLPQKIVSEKRTISLYKITGKSDRADYLNVALGPERVWGVEESGFYDQDEASVGRWTNGAAKMIVPLDKQWRPKALQINLGSTGPKGTKLQVLVNSHELFSGQIPPGAWSKTLSFTHLNLGEQATIELLSDTFIQKEIIKDAADSRTLGVSVLGISMLERNLGTPLPDEGHRSHLNIIGKERNLSISAKESVSLMITVRNMGKDPFPALRDLGRYKGSVRLGILWFAKGQTGKRLAEHRAELPRTMFHDDEAQIDVALNPVGHDGKRLPPGDYEVWIGLVQEGMFWFYQKGDKVLKLNLGVKG